MQPAITHITPRRGINDDHLGKKHALSKLIHAAQTEYVWLHDDDVLWPSAALNSQLTSTEFPLSLGEGWGEVFDLIILPLRMEPAPSLERVKSSARSDSRWLSVEQLGVGLLSSLQIAEYAAIQELTMRSAKKGKAVMCSGANLIVRREAWLACEPDLHPEIPSGDDMFLLEAMKRRGMKIAVIDEPDYTAVVRPAPTWRAFFRQRMRWAGKAPKYTDKDIIRCGALVAAANILQLLCPPILLIKFPIEYSLIRYRQKTNAQRPTPNAQRQTPNAQPPTPNDKRPTPNDQRLTTTKKPQTSWLVALLLELLYPFYLLISLLGGIFRPKEW